MILFSRHSLPIPFYLREATEVLVINTNCLVKERLMTLKKTSHMNQFLHRQEGFGLRNFFSISSLGHLARKAFLGVLHQLRVIRCLEL